MKQQTAENQHSSNIKKKSTATLSAVNSAENVSEQVVCLTEAKGLLCLL